MHNDLKTEFESQGFVGPCRLLSSVEAKSIAADAWRDSAVQQPWAVQFRAHEQIPILRELVLSPVVLSVVGAILGPDIVFWGGRYFATAGQLDATRSRVRWHQEVDFCRALGNGLSAVGVQLYLALDEATRDNGTMQVIPGSHKDPLFDVEAIYDKSLLFDPGTNGHKYSGNVVGQIVASQNRRPVDLVCEPGEFYLFDWKLVHQTGEHATTCDRRLTANARYTTPHANFASPFYTDRFPEPLRCGDGTV